VGAIDDRATPRRSDDVMAGFSGQGPTAADGLTKPDIVAPGRSVISLRAPNSRVDIRYPGSRIGSAYFMGSGTSFATAVTSGSVALLLHKSPTLTPNQVKDRLLRYAYPGPARDPNIDGHGGLDIYKASQATTLTSANKGVARSLGTGSIADDRGTLNVQINLLGTLTQLTGDLTAQGKPFDDVEYTTVKWTGTSWYTSQWAGTSWYTTSWDGTSWYGTSWYGTSWYGTSWYAIAWE
jgi:serine protease AprX